MEGLKYLKRSNQNDLFHFFSKSSHKKSKTKSQISSNHPKRTINSIINQHSQQKLPLQSSKKLIKNRITISMHSQQKFPHVNSGVKTIQSNHYKSNNGKFMSQEKIKKISFPNSISYSTKRLKSSHQKNQYQQPEVGINIQKKLIDKFDKFSLKNIGKQNKFDNEFIYENDDYSLLPSTCSRESLYSQDINIRKKNHRLFARDNQRNEHLHKFIQFHSFYTSPNKYNKNISKQTIHKRKITQFNFRDGTNKFNKGSKVSQVYQ